MGKEPRIIQINIDEKRRLFSMNNTILDDPIEHSVEHPMDKYIKAPEWTYNGAVLNSSVFYGYIRFDEDDGLWEAVISADYPECNSKHPTRPEAQQALVDYYYEIVRPVIDPPLDCLR